MERPRAFSSGRRSVSTPVNAFTKTVLPWSMWPAVATIMVGARRQEQDPPWLNHLQRRDPVGDRPIGSRQIFGAKPSAYENPRLPRITYIPERRNLLSMTEHQRIAKIKGVGPKTAIAGFAARNAS